MHVKMRESLYSQVIIWTNIMLDPIDTTLTLHEYECSCMVYKPK